MSEQPKRAYFLMPSDRELLREFRVAQDDVRTEAQLDLIPVPRRMPTERREDGDAAPRS